MPLAGQIFLVYEFISPGASIAATLRGTQLEEATRVYYAREIATGMAYLHEMGIIHGSLKPGV